MIEIKPRQKITAHRKQISTVREIQTIINRLYIQTHRRPSSLIISLTQPLLWLILFGALFQNAPIYLFEGRSTEYKEFLNSGIIVFTAFNSSVNSGLPVIFDREFGFINRILISPLISKKSIVYSCIIYSWFVANTQVLTIISFHLCQLGKTNSLYQLMTILTISSLIIISISSLSICSAFILPGHIEFIALSVLFVNLPTLFTSTALAPLTFMPYWLQIIVCINPLTYAIEIIRKSQIEEFVYINTEIVNTVLFKMEVKESLAIILIINLVSLTCINRTIKYKYD